MFLKYKIIFALNSKDSSFSDRVLLNLSNIIYLFGKAPLATHHEIHFGYIVETFIDKHVFISCPKLSGLKSERNVIQKVRIH